VRATSKKSYRKSGKAFLLAYGKVTNQNFNSETTLSLTSLTKLGASFGSIETVSGGKESRQSYSFALLGHRALVVRTNLFARR